MRHLRSQPPRREGNGGSGPCLHSLWPSDGSVSLGPQESQDTDPGPPAPKDLALCGPGGGPALAPGCWYLPWVSPLRWFRSCKGRESGVKDSPRQNGLPQLRRGSGFPSSLVSWNQWAVRRPPITSPTAEPNSSVPLL